MLLYLFIVKCLNHVLFTSMYRLGFDTSRLAQIYVKHTFFYSLIVQKTMSRLLLGSKFILLAGKFKLRCCKNVNDAICLHTALNDRTRGRHYTAQSPTNLNYFC